MCQYFRYRVTIREKLFSNVMLFLIRDIVYVLLRRVDCFSLFYIFITLQPVL